MDDSRVSPSASSAARPQDRPRLIFSSSFEGMFVRALGSRLTPELKAKFRSEGVDLDKKLAPGYTSDVWLRCINHTAAAIYPTLPLEQAYFKLGEDFIRGYAETTIGHAMFGVLKLLGPMKAVARLERSFHSGNNYVKTSFTQLSPTSAQVWISGVEGKPWFNAGILLEGGRRMGTKNLRVEILQCIGDEATYRASWDA